MGSAAARGCHCTNCTAPSAAAAERACTGVKVDCCGTLPAVVCCLWPVLAVTAGQCALHTRRTEGCTAMHCHSCRRVLHGQLLLLTWHWTLLHVCHATAHRQLQAASYGTRLLQKRCAQPTPLLSLLSTSAVAAARASVVLSNLLNAFSFTICNKKHDKRKQQCISSPNLLLLPCP